MNCMAYCGENVLWKTISKLGLSVATELSVPVYYLAVSGFCSQVV